MTLEILLVEDEVLNRTLVKAILARSADERLRTAQLREADTIAAARQILAEGSVDIVLLDVQLPDGSGLTLARELLAGPGDRPATMLALTAGALPEQHDAALAAGCDAVLTKPYTVEEFETVLFAHLDRLA